MNQLNIQAKTHIAQEVASISKLPLSNNQITKHITPAKNASLADYQLNFMAFHRYKILKKGSEKTLVAKIFKNFQQETDLVTCLPPDGSFLLFKINKALLIQTVIKEVTQQGNKYGHSNIGLGKKVLVEYSSPNIAKPFHIGHMRSTIIGNFLASLLETQNYEVIRINYLGDWGKQYGLLALAYKKWLSGKTSTDPIKDLFDIYVKINKQLKAEREETGEKQTPTDIAAQDLFRKMENGDAEELELWQKLRNLSIIIYQKMYDRLNIKFDHIRGESIARHNIPQVLKEMQDSNLLSTDEKGTYIDLDQHKLGRAVMLKSDQTTMYMTRDLAEIHDRWTQFGPFEKCYYVVGQAQEHHFKQFFKVLELMNSPVADKCEHVGFGLVLGMKTREGQAVFLNDLMDNAKTKMMEVMQENEDKFKNVENPEQTADTQGLSAILIQDLSAKRLHNYKYDEERMTSFQGETGPYLQYAHARICSILRTAKARQNIQLNKSANPELLIEEQAFLLCKHMSKYPHTLQRCIETKEPVGLVEYLMDLAKEIAKTYLVIRVLDQDMPLAESRLLLYWCARTVLANGLRLLGLNPIEAM